MPLPHYPGRTWDQRGRNNEKERVERITYHKSHYFLSFRFVRQKRERVTLAHLMNSKQYAMKSRMADL